MRRYHVSFADWSVFPQEKLIEPSRIGFDFDGVIADTVESFLRIACEQYAVCDIDPEQITCFQVEECLDMAASIVDEIFSFILRDSLGAGLNPMPGCREVLTVLSACAPVTVITARPFAGPVLQWFEHHMPQRVNQKVRLVTTGDHDDKSRYIKKMNLSHFVDDRGHTCALLEQDGIRSILFAQPWNRSYSTLPRVNNWDEIRSLCFHPDHTMYAA